MSVALIGPESDPQIDVVTRELEARGVETTLWNSANWPGETPATIRQIAGETTVIIGDEQISPADYRTIYLRQLDLDPRYPKFESDFEERPLSVINQLREYRGLVMSAIKHLRDAGVRVINPPEVLGIHGLKPWQLSRLADAGVPVPETLSTNDPDEVRAFADRVGDVIYKPIGGGGGHAHRLEGDDLGEERLSRLANSPVQFQERVDGDDVRVFVVDGEVVAAGRIRSDALDYRSERHGVERIPVADLDPAIERAVLEAADCLELPFTGIDVVDAGDRFVVLEANPSPMFATFDELAGTTVASELAAFLAEP